MDTLERIAQTMIAPQGNREDGALKFRPGRIVSAAPLSASVAGCEIDAQHLRLIGGGAYTAGTEVATLTTDDQVFYILGQVVRP